jgi:hypothetical protein
VNLKKVFLIFNFQELFPKLCNVLKDLPHVSTIVVFEEPHKGDIPPLPEGSQVRVRTFNEIIELGQTSQVCVLLW